MVGPKGLVHGEGAIAAFAQQLGITAAEDEHFGWIAEVGIQSPLPTRFTSHTDEATGLVYYVDHDCQTTSWENPLVPYLRRVVEIGRQYLKQPSEDFWEDQKGVLWHQHKYELDGWHGPFSDPEGRSYFVNSSAGVSSWQDPRIDAQYIFELESGLLTSLEEVLLPLDGLGNNRPWHTDEGAEVLTIDGGSADFRPVSRNRMSMSRTRSQFFSSLAKSSAKEEQKSMVQSMASTASWLKETCENEEEVQRIALAKKVEARRRRLKQRGAESDDRSGVVGHAAKAKARKPRRPMPQALAALEAFCGDSDKDQAEQLSGTPLPPSPACALPPPPPPIKELPPPCS